MKCLIQIFRVAMGILGTMILFTVALASYPDRPIKLIVPYAPGGITDSMARALADGIGRELKQPVIVENRPGAGAMVGTGIAARSPADGYTILIATNGNMTVTPLVTKRLTYDPIRELRVFSVIAEVPTVVVANVSAPYSDLRGLAAYGKANEGKLNVASLGQGNVIYLTAKKIETELGIRMTEVPYKGSVPALTALMSDEVQVYVDVLPGALPFIQAGKLKALAVPMNERLPWLPNTPTLQEAGYAKFHAASWLGLAVPSGTPPDVVATLQQASARFIRDEKFRATFTKAGILMLQPMEPGKMDEYIKADRDRWGALIREHHISID